MTRIKVYRLFIVLLLLISLIAALIITYFSYHKEEWATLASAMTVITAVLAIFSSLNLVWRQEDDKRPQLNLFIDKNSHKYAYSIIIRNDGGSPAYNVKIVWSIPLIDYEGKEARFTSFEEEYDFEYLQTGISFPRFIMGSDSFQELAEKSEKPLNYYGKIEYSLRPRSKYRHVQDFRVSLEPFKKKLNVMNDQMDFYFENKQMTKQLRGINDSLAKLVKILNKSE